MNLTVIIAFGANPLIAVARTARAAGTGPAEAPLPRSHVIELTLRVEYGCRMTSDAPAPASEPTTAWPVGLTTMGFGGDYNPEQWPVETRLEDIELMAEAGVNVVSLAIFSWATLEPREGELDFGWLDDMMDRLHAGGVRVALATATASPPPWLTRRHPEILPQLADGTVLGQGGRQSYAVASPVYREYAAKMAATLAERYGDHPALALWHVDNEIGCHTAHDYSDAAADAFRVWLEARYGDVESLNQAWGTAFWSQRYGSFDDVLPPRTAPTYANPTQQLDFARYSSDQLLSYYTLLRDTLRPITPHVPITTNFMAAGSKWMDYFAWGAEVDVVANDHYTTADDAERQIELAFSADLTRGIARGKGWILMEHSTGAVNWQPRNRAKAPGEMLRNSLQHVARGADAVMFFQWRQSKAGAEKFHSALVPHAGRDSQVWRDAVALGQALKALIPVTGSRVEARTAIVFDYASWWAVELDSHPSVDVTYPERMRALYRELWNRGVAVDFVTPESDLGGYQLILAPTLYLVTDEGAANIAAAAERGASVLITYFSGIVDQNDHIRLGGYPGAFRDLLGVSTDEFFPLLAQESVTLDDGTTADVWTERVRLTSAGAVRTFTDGPMAGGPAVTRNAVGSGAAWYAATRQDAASISWLVGELLAESDVEPVVVTSPGVEVVRRTGADGARFLFVINHTDGVASVPATGTDLLTGTDVQGEVEVAAGVYGGAPMV